MTIETKGIIIETKKRRFVSAMKEKIIRASIESLRQEGLKFSIDTLADKLKISKKTVYKYFPDKETLALVLYEKYYDDVMKQADKLVGNNKEPVYSTLLHLYFDSKIMTRSEIFNKYKLNNTIYIYAAKRNDLLWAMISTSFNGMNAKEEQEVFRLIIDGTFEKLCNDKISPDTVIERLVELL